MQVTEVCTLAINKLSDTLSKLNLISEAEGTSLYFDVFLYKNRDKLASGLNVQNGVGK